MHYLQDHHRHHFPLFQDPFNTHNALTTKTYLAHIAKVNDHQPHQHHMQTHGERHARIPTRSSQHQHFQAGDIIHLYYRESSLIVTAMIVYNPHSPPQA